MTINNHFNTLDIGSVKPGGWLLATLKAQASGLTGLLDEVPPRRGFRVNPVTGDSVWLGGGAGRDFLAIRSERAPYYVRGLVLLAYVLNDPDLIEKAGKWLNYWFEHQDKDGRLKARGVSDYEWWPRMLILDAVRFYYEATGDMRSITFMQRFFHFQRKNLKKHPLTKNLKYYPERRSWASFRGGDNLDSLAWLYSLTEDLNLLEIAQLINRQTYPWEERFLDLKDINTHGVNLAHGLRKPAVQHLFWGDDRLKRAVRAGLRKAMHLHGQVSGVFSGDEVTHGRGPSQGAELCTIVELMRTYEILLRVYGSPAFGDALERLAYNALPAAVASDFRSHQYFSQQNQVYCTIGRHGFHVNKMDLPYPLGWHHDSLAFGAPAGYECCFYNFHMGWPLFTANMWMKYGNDGLAKVVYGPCEVETRIAGIKVRITEDTAYPFENRVVFTVNCDEPLSFALILRIPRWCPEGTAAVGKEVYRGVNGSYLVLRRGWKNGEKVVLELPAEPRMVEWYKGNVSVEHGALVFAYNPDELWVPTGNSEKFPTFEVVPAEEEPVKNSRNRWAFNKDVSWNFGLNRDVPLKAEHGEVSDGEEVFPWTPGNAPVKIRASARRIPDWSRQDTFITGLNAPPPPENPFSSGNDENILLVPYGCARLRISVFPGLT